MLTIIAMSSFFIYILSDCNNFLLLLICNIFKGTGIVKVEVHVTVQDSLRWKKMMMKADHMVTQRGVWSTKLKFELSCYKMQVVISQVIDLCCVDLSVP